MTNGEVWSFAALYLVGLVVGAATGKRYGSMWLGVCCAVLLGPLLGLPALWAIKGGPIYDRRGDVFSGS